ncbi:MAG: ATP-dependent zinc protease [Pseudomonadota bacterium]
MSQFSKFSLILALCSASGCSYFQTASEPAACPATAPTNCPVCPASTAMQCPEAQIVERIVEVPTPVPTSAEPALPLRAGTLDLPIIGALEWATVEPGNLTMEARIDTGAEFTSIHAEDIQLVEKDGVRWVQFSLVDPATGAEVPLEQRLKKRVRIKQSNSESESRYVVELWITMGKIHSLVEVTLSDRAHMEYPLLIGRNMLVDTMIVDVSARHTIAPPD